MKNLFRGAVPEEITQPGYGLHVLVEKDPDGEGVTDVVAVHGLNGHYEKTWTTYLDNGTPYNWVREVLPKLEGVNARVMSFSYNSSVQFSKSTSDVFTFADQLLEHLLAQRGNLGEATRPIVFICHSLGGLVVKQALNRATENDRFKDAILSRVFGICFFGTPHRGSELAPWGSTISRILRAGAIGSHTNSQLTKDLERKSQVLGHISKSFLQHGRKLKIVSFIETEKLNWLNSLVVDQDSAILAWPDEIVVPVDGNHREMCRFTGLQDPKFAPVAFHLRGMFREILQIHLQTIAPIYARKGADLVNVMGPSEILVALRSDYGFHKSRNPTAVPGTCSWILGHPKMKAWEEDPRGSLLWLSADAGCGKSVMASFLVDYFKEDPGTEAAVCYFFFKDDSMEQSNAVVAMSAVLHQLFSAHPALLSLARQQLMIPGNSLARLETLWKMFLDAVENHVAKPSAICILDGLDECDEASRKQLMALISEYFTPSTTESRTRKLRLMVLSRPDNSIKMMFDKQASKARKTTSITDSPRYDMIRLRGEDETDAISKDIELVVHDAMEDLADKGMPEDLLNDVETALVTGADRTFLWTALMIQLLKDKSVEGASRKEINSILHDRSVYSIYSALLNSKTGTTSSTQSKARKVLSLILGAIRPLAVEELNIALAIKPDHDSFAVLKSRPKPSRRTFLSVEYEIVYPPENHIKALCGHFIRIIQGKVYLVHQTARAFLLDEASARDRMAISVRGFYYADDSEDDLWDLSDSESEQYQVSSSTDYMVVDEAQSETLMSDCSTERDWQHTFSLERCHSLLLEICVTYLYMLGKPSSMAALGQPTDRLASFLAYAANYWVTHFHNVCRKIPPGDLSYYHGLCHPRFPGFTTWLEAYDGMGRVPIFTGSGSVDDQQDLMIEKFALEPAQPGFGSDFTTKVDFTRSYETGLGQMLSCNPSQSQNMNFPVKADETGVVTLDFDLAKRRSVDTYTAMAGNASGKQA